MAFSKAEKARRHKKALAQGSTCGAKTRAGTPCKQRELYSSGRCRFHGGLSTGANTPEGREKLSRLMKERRGRQQPHENLTKPDF